MKIRRDLFPTPDGEKVYENLNSVQVAIFVDKYKTTDCTVDDSCPCCVKYIHYRRMTRTDEKGQLCLDEKALEKELREVGFYPEK